MTLASNCAGPIALALLSALGQAGCNAKTPSLTTSAATPPIAPPPPAARDTPPAAAEAGKPTDQGAKSGGLKVSPLEYEGWRQYSVNCARCHGQDALPNPVAANLLISVGPKGPFHSYDLFAEVVTGGRPASGMPAASSTTTES